MLRWRNFFWIVLLLLSGGRLLAASAAEKRDFNFAGTLFNIGDWTGAQTNFARFLQKYPNSERFAEAVLFEAQSALRLKQFDSAMQLLRANQAKAGFWADQFRYWIAEAQLGAGDLSGAADSFAGFGKDFPASTNLLNASLREAEARSRLRQWQRVVGLLQAPDAPFQRAIKSGETNELVATGYLLLGESLLALGDFDGVKGALEWLASKKLGADLAWRRSYLECRWQISRGRLPEALEATSNMLASASASAALTAETVAMRADVLERLGRLEEAVAAYKKYLSGEVPAERQRAAMLKVAELSLAQSRISEAVQSLENFLNHYTNSAAGDVALLTLGELRLKEFLTDASATNLLSEAVEKFDRALKFFPDGALSGKAWLDKGWCYWLLGEYERSQSAFSAAAGRLTNSADEVVARFKWADSQFKLRDFAGAITNYNYLTARNEARAKSGDPTIEQALYQTVRAALELGQLEAATNALEKILAWYPRDFSAGRVLLLTGEGFIRETNTVKARDLFSRFEEMYPTNVLASEVRLAIARSFEQESNWAAAITNYDLWSLSFTNNPDRPSVEFNRAWDNYKAGNDTNAFRLFTNFVARFPADANAQLAQWWIADYFFRLGDWTSAELNYQLVFKSTNWPQSELTCQAQMMAGRSAVARFSYGQATNYFANLAGDTNCPIDLRLQASFACGDALMSRTDTTNHDADLHEAVEWFESIYTKYPTSQFAPAAWGRAGDCYLQLAAATNRFYEMSSNAYQQVLLLSQATVSARSQAAAGLGLVAEKLASQKNGDERQALFRLALERYEDVCLGNILRDAEQPDLYFVKEAGLDAVRVATEDLADWKMALNLSSNIVNAFPQLRPVFEAKMNRAQEHLSAGKP